MKRKQWFGMLGAIALACAAMIPTGAMEARGETAQTSYELKDLVREKSSDALAVDVGGGYIYAGNDKKEESLNQWVTFSFETEAAGDYNVKLVTKKHKKKGVFQMSVNGKAVGKPFDQYTTGKEGECTVEFGTIHIETPGPQEVKFEILEKNAACPTYQIAIKTLILTKEETPAIPDVDFGENKVSDSGNVISYPMPYVYKESQSFSVKADGLEIPVVEYRGEYDYAHFSMEGTQETPVTIEVTYKESITKYEISPGKLGIEGETDGNSLTFSLEKDAYLILRMNGGKRLVIAADAMESEKPESTGEGIFNILEAPYQAERTGTLLSTAAIQRAINDASRYGTEHGTRGTVYVPAGVYQSSSLVLKSNMELYLEGGALIRATLDGSKYVVRGNKNSIGKDVIHFIYTENNKIANPYDLKYQDPENYIESENMRIYGRGTIDARGRELEREAGLLSQSLVPMNCSNFAADGVILRDTGVWSVAPGLSDNMEFTNLKIVNTMNHEDDCIDINGCQDVVVRNVIGVALDDPFSTKTWESGELFQAWCGEPEINENILFEDCLSWSYCYGFKVGQGSWQDQRGIVFRDSTVYDCAVGLGVHHKYGTAVLEDITFENIDIEHVTNTNDSHRTWLHMQAITGGEEGVKPIQNVTIRNIRVMDKGTSTAKLIGYSEEYGIEGVRMEKIYMDHLGGYAKNLDDLDIKDLYMYCGGLTLDGRRLPDSPSVTIIQLEDLKEEAKYSENCPEPGVGDGYIYIGSAAGDWASFPVEVKAGTYKLDVMLKRHSSKGIFQMYLNDEPVGEPYDQYYNGNKTGVTANFGTVTFEEDGVQNFRFEIVGKNEASGGYALVLDALKLTGIVDGQVKLDRIEITQTPEKTTYFVGEKADYTGLIVTACYEDGDTKVLVPEEYTVEGFSTAKPGVIRITVAYEDKTAEFELEVIDFSEDTQQAMKELEDRIASASNAEQIREAADDVIGFFDWVEALTDKVFEIARDLERALLRLDKDIRATKVTISEDVEEEFGICARDVKVEGAAVTAHANRFEDSASPSNAVVRIETPDEEWDLMDGYEEESAARFKLSVDVASGEEIAEDTGLFVPVRLTLPYPRGMKAGDAIWIFYRPADGGPQARLTPEQGEQGLTVILRACGDLVIAKEETKKPNPDDGGDEDPGYEDPGYDEQPNGGGSWDDDDDDDDYDYGFTYNRRSSANTTVTTTPGEWTRDGRGWRYCLTDGNYPKNDWVISKNVWYYFDENGYMKTGWVIWKGKWYYLNETGACVVNTVTPDGYQVDQNGAWIQ